MIRLLVLALLWSQSSLAHDSRPGLLTLNKDQLGIHVAWTPPRITYGQSIRPKFGTECSYTGEWLRCKADVSVRFENPRGVRFEAIVQFRSEDTHRILRITDTAFHTMDEGALGDWGAFVKYVPIGAMHVLVGWDHLAFVLLLLLLTTQIRQVVLALTGFTIGHSVTLIGAALGQSPLNVQWVEVAIALSLVVLAAELLRPPEDTLTRRRPATIAALFGLVHGFGFAGALADIGLPPDAVMTALLGFNVGVELGQIIVAAAAIFVGIGFTRWKPSTIPHLRHATAWGVGMAGTLAVVIRLAG